MLASIDLRSQHGRLVSARFNASVRKGVQGSCKRAASQAAGRAYRIVLQRSRPRRGEKEGSKGLPGQNFSKGLFSLFTRHGVHRGRNAGYDRSLCSALVLVSTKSKHARMGPRLGMRDRAWLGMLTATACDAGIDRWADMRDAESGIRDPGSGMIPKEGSGIINRESHR